MTLWGIFFTAYLVGFSGALAPGPLLTVTVNESFRRGFRAGPQLITGHALLEVVIVIIIASGLYRFLRDNSLFYGIIAFFGGLFMLWMGWQLCRGAAQSTIRLELDAKPEKSKFGPLVLGALTSLANPYFLFWWLTVGAGYVVMAMAYGVVGVSVFTVGHVLADYTWYSLVSATVGGGRRFFNQAVYRVVLFSCGLFLLVLAAYFVYAGFQFLRMA